MKYLIVILLTVSCGHGINFDPDIYTFNQELLGINNEKGHFVGIEEELVNEFGCMHQSKLAELRIILQSAEMPRKKKLHALSILNSMDAKFTKQVHE